MKHLITRIQNHGFQPDVIVPEDYVFGAMTKIPDEILQPDGQWDSHLPIKEVQFKNGFESMNCTNYGTNNCYETIEKRKYGGEPDYSERYTGVNSGTTQSGNSPQKAAEAVRDKGMIREDLLPFDDTIDSYSEYFFPKPMTSELLIQGKNWLDKYNVMHEWIDNINSTTLKESLKRSPVGISVWAWSYEPSTGYYVNPGNVTPNHWVELYGYEDGKYWKIFDHYEKDHKKLCWNYPFQFAKKYYLERKHEETYPTPVDGTIDGNPIPTGTRITFWQFWRWIPIFFNKLKGKK
jgi:hypothetical protein